MATLAHLQQHLPPLAFNTIQSQFGFHVSPFLTSTGVNYNYKGNSWNIRIGFDEQKTQIFVRAHSNQKICGYQFSDASFYQMIHLSKSRLYEESDTYEKQSSTPPRHFKFMKIIKDGILLEDKNYPNFDESLKAHIHMTYFFRSCPDLLSNPYPIVAAPAA